MNVTHLIVRDDRHEWGEFFVAERDPVTDSGGRLRYSATWTCYSSFGTFGHYWHSMGSRFGEFIQDVEVDYLLGKIANRVPSDEKAIAGVRREIIQRRRYQSIDKEVARDAWNRVDAIAQDEFVMAALWNDEDISKVGIEWCELTTTDWDSQAVGFAKKIWPVFVKEMAKRLECAAK